MPAIPSEANTTANTLTTPPLVFISYSHADKKERDTLQKYLSPAQRSGRISIWSDNSIMAGDKGDEEIHNAIKQARVAVLLISQNYLDSEWLASIEIPQLFEGRQSRGLRIVPVLLRPCMWQEFEWLRSMQLLPEGAKPIMGRAASTRNKLWTEIANIIVQLAAGQPNTQPKPTPPSSTGKRAPSTAPVKKSRSGTELTIDSLSDLQFYDEGQESMRLARVLATLAGDETPKVSTSCLLFGLSELGRTGQADSHTPQFFWEQLKGGGEELYWKEFRRKFPEAPYASTDNEIDYDSLTDEATLITSNVRNVCRLASAISLRTYREDVPETESASGSSSGQMSVSASNVRPFKAGGIGARHLLAALLTYQPTRGGTGAASRLSRIVPNPGQLRANLLDYIAVHSTDKREDLAMWAAILMPEMVATEESGDTASDERPATDSPVESGDAGGGAAPVPVVPVVPVIPLGDFNAPLAGFLTDYWQGADLLGITPDVNALASLVAAWSVEPPLSIGLFGDWGSGKTHFMRQMKARVEKLSLRARDSKKPQHKIGYYKNIVQIEFNAWHYIEGNLWASLVEHIFQNLRMSKDDDEAALKLRRDELLKKLLDEEAAQRDANAAVKAAQKQVDAKEQEIKTIEQEQKEKTEKLAELSKKDALAAVKLSIILNPQTQTEVDEALKAAGVPRVGGAASDLQAALSEAHAVFTRGNALLTPMLKAPDGPKRFYLLLLILIGAPVVSLIILLLFRSFGSQISNLYAVLSGAATLMTSAAFWIRKQAAWISGWTQKLEAAKQKVDAQIEKEKAEAHAHYTEQMTAQEQQLKALQTKLDASLREREAAQRRVDEATAALKQSSVVERLGRFIQDRAASDDYRKHLGVIALIRRDFEKLASLFGEQRAEASNGDGDAEDDETINRIILYIDDLDRCPPERVVQVLQAIHLLLAFPLFVVVVGVDARWVTRSLQESYEWLRVGDEDEEGKDSKQAPGRIQAATPHDYLEKIFQIPFWLKPMGDDACKALLDGLTRDGGAGANAGQNGGPPEPDVETPDADETAEDEAAPVDAQLSDTQTDDAEPETEPAAQGDAEAVDAEGEPQAASADEAVPVDEQPGGTDSQTSENAEETPGDVAAVAVVKPEKSVEQKAADADDEKIELAPQSLKLTDEEINWMKELTPLLGRSPRAVKRFLNCYRLIKVGLRPEQLDAFLGKGGHDGEFKPVMLLLSVITGAPAISLYFIEELEKWAQAASVGSLHEFLKRLNQHPEINPHPDWARVKGFLESFIGHGTDSAETLSMLMTVAPRVSRYSFRVARVEAARVRGVQAKSKG